MADAPARTEMVSATGSAEGGFLLSTLQSMVNWCRKNSVWPLPLGLSCCGIEFMATAAMLGIDTCPMEGIDPARYDSLLGLSEQGYGTVVACVAGYRSADDKYAQAPKVRFKIEDVVVRFGP